MQGILSSPPYKVLDNSWLLFTLLQTTSQTFQVNGFHLEQPCAAQPSPSSDEVPASRGVPPSRPSNSPASLNAAVTDRIDVSVVSSYNITVKFP